MSKAEKIESLVTAAIPNSDIELEGEDCSFTIWIISDSFEGKRSIQRQQSVLQSVGDMLKTGELHALTVKAFTPSEWEEQRNVNSQSVQITL